MEKKNYITTIRIPENLFEKIKQVKKETGCNYNNLIWLALFNYLNEFYKPLKKDQLKDVIKKAINEKSR